MAELPALTVDGPATASEKVLLISIVALAILRMDAATLMTSRETIGRDGQNLWRRVCAGGSDRSPITSFARASAAGKIPGSGRIGIAG